MNRYHSSRRSSSNTAAVPIVAFLLVACFGLLFVTGCSRSTTDSNGQTTQDDTFTQEDMARFQQMAQQSSSTMAQTGTSATGAEMSSAPAMAVITQSGSAASVPAPDPALRKEYDIIRAMSGGNGGNMYRVTNSFLNVRSQPGVSGTFVVRLNGGDIVNLIEFVNAGWARIQVPGGAQGYVATRYIAKLTTDQKLADDQKAFAGLYYVNFAFVNVRAAPQTGSAKIGEIPGQAFVRPISVDKDWARVSFEGKDGYVSMQFLALFKPTFLVRQDSFTLPILHFSADQDGMIDALAHDAAQLKQNGTHFMTFTDFADLVRAQETHDARLPAHSVILAVTGVTADNVRKISDSLAGIPATLFIQTDQVGLSGITEKTMLTLLANNLDIQSAGHTGDDLRTLTTDQTRLELGQSKALIESIAHKTVYAVAYPQGGANDRVLTQAAEAGYLFGMATAPDKSFTRDQFMRLPSFTVTTGMTPQDVTTLTK